MRVLLVEDYEPVRESVTCGLREAGFAVDATGDGEEGLWYLGSSEYDVVILDLTLPGVDGLTILRKIRAAAQPVHVLILTAKDTVEDRVRGLKAGADDYLVKPFAFDELLARVQALVRRKYDTKSPVIRIADLEIDTGMRLARRAGEPVTLTAREYALLELLAARAPEVVTRTEIWEHIYEFAEETTSNVVDVYIGHLRKKIEREGLPRLLHTRRGIGYSIGELD